MKNLRLLALPLIVIAVVLVATNGGECDANYRNDRQVQINSTVIKTEVASSPAQKAKGLGGRACIGQNQGMLFVFDKPARYAFWMKDMKFPIDIVWIDTDHKVVAQEIDVQPSTFPDSFINEDKPAKYVLELPANRSEELKINLGTQINF